MYELFQEKSLNFTNKCLALAFDGSHNLIIISDEQIIIYKFNDGYLKKIQRIVTEFSVLKKIYLTSLSTQFICYGEKNSIEIWRKFDNQIFQMTEQIDAHQNRITCLIMNKKEDIIVTSGYDALIKFWNYSHGWSESQILKCHQSSIYKIDLNRSENQLVSSCGYQIVVSEKQILWAVKQILKIYDQSAMFYGETTLIIQDRLFSQFQVFEHQINLFIKTSTYLFEKNQHLSKDIIAINEQISYLVVKNGTQLLFLKKQKNNEFLFQQTIEIQNLNTPYTLSTNGQYFVLLDSCKLIIRKLKFN